MQKISHLKCAACATTIAAGIVHLSFVHPFHGSLQTFSIFFLVSGIAQIFWIIPIVRDWHKAWYYVGIGGTAVLIVIWVLSRTTTLIVSRPFHIDQMGIFEESMQIAFIALVAAILIYKSRTNQSSGSTRSGRNKTGIFILSGIVVAIILVGLFVPLHFGPMGPPPPHTSTQQLGSQLPPPTTQTGVATNQTCNLTPSLIEMENTPQQTEGPYFVDEMLNRSDIRSDPSDNTVQDGIPLHLVIHVYNLNGNSCTPFSGAQVDIWHANYQGLYSDIQGINTLGKKYLRGYQVTDNNGLVQFTTIYPGWYEGRTVHVHIKIRTFDGSKTTFEWTSQFYFNDTITDQVDSQPPYSSHGPHTVRNNDDGIFTGPSTDGMVQSDTGTHLMLHLTKDDQGYLGTFNVVIDASKTT